ncbi:hypothetical protein [Hymenobacter lucidus]|uniref:Outer membrane lipoprotein carrier protein LolA n=1 Tax=Hymenobacter lucidus TaxID=2880930 RepID=A0ABS8AZD1_9BACT|nr:hypothetical protein [Hymenobacter lucidus]MCB2411148.1 hypothetical protein [Hymenobacter lucidus]
MAIPLSALWSAGCLWAATLSLPLASFPTAPIPTADACKQELMNAYAHLQTGQQTVNGKAFYVHFLSQTAYRIPGQDGERQSSVDAQLYTSGNQVYFHTPEVTMWQDGQFVVSVIQRQHTVFITRVLAGKKGPDPGQFTVFRDSLIRQSQVAFCRTEQVQNTTQQHLQLVLPLAGGNRSSNQKLEFWLREHRVQKMVINYGPGMPLSRLTLSFLKQQWVDKPEKLTADARAQILDKTGHLRPAYQGYRLVDQTSVTQTRK